MKLPPPLLIGALAIGAAARVLQAHESLWLDELHTSWVVTGPLSEVAERAMIGNQSPLYFWVAWFFARLPIVPEIALRLPSLLAGCALPLAVYWLTNKLLAQSAAEKETTPALIAAWLTALDPLAIFYAQEARPYAILQLITVMHIGAMLMVMRTAQKRWRFAWIISGALLVHVHYTAGLILLGEFVAVAMSCCFEMSKAESKTVQRSKSWLQELLPRLIDFGIVGLLLTPALYGMADVAARRDQWTEFVQPEWPHRILTMFPCAAFCVGLLGFQRWKRLVEPRSLTLLSGWLLVPLVVAWMATVTGVAPLFFPRYLLAAWPASMVAAGMFWVVPRKPASRQIYVVAILAWQLYSGSLWQHWHEDGRLLHDRNEDWRQALATLAPAVTFNRFSAHVLVRSGFIEADELRQRNDSLFHEYCLAPVRGMYCIEPLATDVFHPLAYSYPGKLQPEVRAALRETDEAWLLIRSRSNPDDRAKMRHQLLRDLQESLGSDIRVEADAPVEFGLLYLQRVQFKALPPESAH